MNKVEMYLHHKNKRNYFKDEVRKFKFASADYARAHHSMLKYEFNMAMNKPTDEEWKEHEWEILQN